MSGIQPRGRDDAIFGVRTKEKKKDPPAPPELQRAMEALTPDSTAEEYKAVGNHCMKLEMFTAALKHYSAALERDPVNEILLSNRSAAYLQSSLLSGPSLALKDAEKCIKARPDWFKGHLRQGDALFAMMKLDAAVAAYDACLRLGPCPTATESRQRCQALLAEQRGGATTDTSGGGGGPGANAGGGDAPSAESGFAAAEKGTARHRYDPRTAAQRKEEEERSRLNPDDPDDAAKLLQMWTQEAGMGASAGASCPAEAPPSPGSATPAPASTSASVTSVASGPTARKAFAASVDEADREGAAQYKAQLMGAFRKRVNGDADMRKALDETIERDRTMSAGGYNYRTGQPAQAASGGTGSPPRLRGTDVVGRAISADSYNTFTGKAKMW